MAISKSDGSIILTTQVDTKGAERGLSSLKGAVKKVGVALGVAFSVKTLLTFSKQASDTATQTEASVQRLIDIYGSASKAVGDFIDANANAMGLSKSAAANFSAVYGNLFSVWADQATNAELTNQYLNMTAVVASKTGRTVEDVQERIRSGLLGNTEAIEDLGIFVNVKTIEMTDAFKRMASGRSWEQLGAYEQQQVRTMAILEQATSKYGTTVAQTSALTKSQFKAAFEDFKNTWGIVVNEVLMPALQVLTKVFQYATLALQSIFNISGQTISTEIKTATKEQDKLTESVEETTKAQKKFLASFDTAEILGSKDSGAGGASTGTSQVDVPALELTETANNLNIGKFEKLRDVIQEIADIFKTGFWKGFQKANFSSVTSSLQGIGNGVQSIATAPEVQDAAQSFLQNFVSTMGQNIGATASIGNTIATNLLGGFDTYLQTNAPALQSSIANIFSAGESLQTTTANLWTAFANLFSVYASENGTILTGNIIEIFSNAFVGVVELAMQFGADFMNLLAEPIISNQPVLQEALDGILGVFASITGTISSLVSGLFTGIKNLYDEHVAPLITTITNTLTELVGHVTEAFNTHILPVLQGFADNFAVVVDEHLKPLFDKIFGFIGNVADMIKPFVTNVLQPVLDFLIDVFAPILGESIEGAGVAFNGLLEVASSIFGSIIDVFNGLVEFLTGIFTGDLGRAFDGIKTTFEGLLDGIISIFKGVLNGIIAVINGFISGVNAAIGVINEIPGVNIKKLKKIPKLAQGTVLPGGKPFMAIVNDQPAGQTNIETPLATMIQAFQTALDSRGGGRNNTPIVLELNGRELGRAIIEEGNRESRRIGVRTVIG